jgi:mono/diheme cytochrome c family protein
MQRVILCAAALCAMTALSAGARAPRSALSAAAVHGRQLFVAVGCYQCHGHGGQGSVGPRLAPNPLPLDVFTRLVRNPLGVMPVYTAVVLPETDVADIYAYLNSIPKPKSVSEIPLLAP